MSDKTLVLFGTTTTTTTTTTLNPIIYPNVTIPPSRSIYTFNYIHYEPKDTIGVVSVFRPQIPNTNVALSPGVTTTQPPQQTTISFDPMQYIYIT